MKNSFHRGVVGLAVGLSALLVHSHVALAYWTGPVYTVSNRVCNPPDNTTTTNTNEPQGDGSTYAINHPSGATVTVKYTWVRNTPSDAPPAKVYVLQYGWAEWNMSAPQTPNGLRSSPSMQDAVFSVHKRPQLHLIQAQAGSGSADNGLGNAQVVTTAANGSTTGTSVGYKVVELTTAPDDTATTSPVTLLVTANPGPGQAYLPHWRYNAQLIGLAITCNGQEITNPKAAYPAYVGQNTALAFSFSGISSTDITQPTWTLPTKYVKDWTHSNSAAAIVPVPATELASTSIPQLFWITGGSKAITFSAKIKDAPISLSGTLSITRPEYAFSATQQAGITLDADTSGNATISYGVGNTGTTTGAGIVFATNPAPPIPNNTLKIAQVITNTTRTVIDGANQTHSWAPTVGLDAFFGPASDSPSDYLNKSDKEITINDSFDTWIMYSPPTGGVEHTDWIWVPLKKFSWSWSAHAKRRNSATVGWTSATTTDSNNLTSDLISATPGQSVSGTVSDTHPTWTQKASPPEGGYIPAR